MNKMLTPKSQCEKCNEPIPLKRKRRYFLCVNCRTQVVLKQKLDVFKEVIFVDEYAQYLYDLYLRYTERYLFKYEILGQAERLLKHFSLKAPDVLVSWDGIFKESKSYDKKHKENKYVVGCPFIKIGKILAELGVLPPKCEDRSQYYIRFLIKFPPNMLDTIKRFIEFEKGKKLLDKTIILHLEFILKFVNWFDIALDPKSKSVLSFDITLVSEMQVQLFLNYLKDKKHTQTYIISVFSGLSIFFRWCSFESMILVNPCENIKLKKPRSKLTICDDGIIKKLIKFIKNPNSNPEQAMILSLILIWGLRSEDLSHAKLEIKGRALKVILRRKKLGTRKYYNRNQELILPCNLNSWFYELQKRFYKNWLDVYKQRKKSYSCYYIFLPRYRSIQPLTAGTIKARVYEATQAAGVRPKSDGAFRPQY